jgi:hypothetical protein
MQQHVARLIDPAMTATSISAFANMLSSATESTDTLVTVNPVMYCDKTGSSRKAASILELVRDDAIWSAVLELAVRGRGGCTLYVVYTISARRRRRFCGGDVVIFARDTHFDSICATLATIFKMPTDKFSKSEANGKLNASLNSKKGFSTGMGSSGDGPGEG